MKRLTVLMILSAFLIASNNLHAQSKKKSKSKRNHQLAEWMHVRNGLGGLYDVKWELRVIAKYDDDDPFLTSDSRYKLVLCTLHSKDNLYDYVHKVVVSKIDGDWGEITWIHPGDIIVVTGNTGGDPNYQYGIQGNVTEFGEVRLRATRTVNLGSD